MSTIKIRTKRIEGITQIRTLISHPMATGRAKDDSGQTIPAHYIRELTVKHNNKIFVNVTLGSGISKDPYFAYKMQGGKTGDKITISWTDNLGGSDSAEAIIS